MVPTASDVAAAAKQAEQLKQEGNFCFKKERFGAAIDAYTEAITLCPNVPIYWTNRALCHRRKNDWKRVEEDCRRAIELDHYSFKVWTSIICNVFVPSFYGIATSQPQAAVYD